MLATTDEHFFHSFLNFVNASYRYSYAIYEHEYAENMEMVDL